MRKSPRTYLKDHRPAPLTTGESVKLWQGVANELGFPAESTDAPTPLSAPAYALWRQPAFAYVAAAVMFALIGGTTAYAANGASPGDLLYPMDLAMERTRLALTADNKQETLRYRYAMERVEELATSIETISENDRYALAQLEAHIEYVDQYLESERLGTEAKVRLRQAFAKTTAPVAQYRQREPARDVMTDDESSEETEATTETPVAETTDNQYQQQDRQQETTTNETSVIETDTPTEPSNPTHTPTQENKREEPVNQTETLQDAEPKREQTDNTTAETETGNTETGNDGKQTQSGGSTGGGTQNGKR